MSSLLCIYSTHNSFWFAVFATSIYDIEQVRYRYFLYSVQTHKYNMHNHTELERRAADQQRIWLSAVSSHCTHQITLQTLLHTQAVKPTAMRERVFRAQSVLRYFIPRFNRALTGNGSRRNNKYLPIIVPVLEGTCDTYNPNKTLHWHLMVGNTPSHIDTTALQQHARDIWRQHDIAQDDVNASTLWLRQGWAGYTTKEYRHGNYEGIDYALLQAPQHILAELNLTNSITRNTIDAAL